MIKCKLEFFHPRTTFFGWMRTVGIVYGYTVFLDRAKFSYNQKQTYGVLETGSVFELFYEWTTTKKMKDPWSS